MNWLIKEEPTHYSFDDLIRGGRTAWTGVRNPLAQKHLQSMRKGDRRREGRGGHREGRMRTVPGSGGQDGKTVRHRPRASKEGQVAGDPGSRQGRQGIRIFPAGPDTSPLSDASHGRRIEAYGGDGWLTVADGEGLRFPKPTLVGTSNDNRQVRRYDMIRHKCPIRLFQLSDSSLGSRTESTTSRTRDRAPGFRANRELPISFRDNFTHVDARTRIPI